MQNTRSALAGIFAALCLSATAPAAFANALLDDSADARTRQVWDYLQAQYGKKMLTGCWTESQYGGAQAFHACTNEDRKSTRLNSSHLVISYAVFCLKKKKKT